MTTSTPFEQGFTPFLPTDKSGGFLADFSVNNLSLRLLRLSSGADYAYLVLSVLPKYSPAEVMKQIKTSTSRVLRAEFELLSKMPNLWMRAYFFSTAPQVSKELIETYVKEQKTRYE